MKTKPLGKRASERVINNIQGRLNELHSRAASHVPIDFTDAQLCEAMIKGEDIAFVRRSAELYGFIRSNYYGSFRTVITDFPDTNYKISIGLNRRSSWLMPAYLSGKEVSCRTLPEAFVPLLKPLVSTLDPLQQAFTAATNGWDALRTICAGDLSRMYFLWPVLGTMAKSLEADLSTLPAPRGVPSVHPELRELLNEGTAFVNAVMMMPETNIYSDNLSISLM